jgi:hypothetical protein
MPNMQHEREPIKPIGTPFSKSPAPLTRVLIRRLPLNTSEESLRLMVVWSQELAAVELLPVEQSEDEGFRAAVLKFKTMAGAQEAKKMLDGRSNISNDAEMVVDILNSSPGAGKRYPNDQPITVTTGSSSINGSAPASRPPPRFNNSFQSLEKISTAQTNGALPTPDSGARYHSIFSPQSPLGTHYSERPRASGKAFIENNYADDDETSDLLKDPVAYAENGPTGGRRATAPQLPIGRMSGLSLNTATNAANTVSTSVPSPYAHSVSAHANPMTPLNGPNLGGSYPIGSQHFQRHNFPPVNPADQNPPCNTLYVGNLPIDTSEEELKAMFSKQRGYKRLCFRTKQNGPMCFVEFEDVSFATKALHELYGHPLHNSIKGGIRLSFSKNPLGVRSGQTPGPSSSPSASSMSGMMPGTGNGFAAANGPPPGLAAPPGLTPARSNYTGPMTNGTHTYNHAGYGGGSGYPWNGYGMTNGMNGGIKANSSHLPPHMMGR